MSTTALRLPYAQSTILLIGGGAVLLVMLVLGTFRLASETGTRAQTIASERGIRIAARQLQIGLLKAETGQRGYLITGTRTYLDPYFEGERSAREGLALLERAVKEVQNPDDIAAFGRIRNTLEEKLKELSGTVELAEGGQREQALAMVESNVGQTLMTALDRDLEEVVARADTQVGLGLTDVARSARQLSITTAFGSALIVAFALLAFYIVAKNTAELVAARNSLEDLTNELERRVDERTQALTEANDEIQRFAYIVSHDLRAPLVNIMGFTSELESASGRLEAFLKHDSPEETERAAVVEIATSDIPESIRFIRSSSVKMDGLIGAILKLSREGRRELQRERIALSELVDAALASLQHQIEAAGATVEVAHPLPSVVSDRIALEQIIGNILDNAVKYLMPGRPGRLTVTSEEGGGRVKLRIADNGRGIAEADLTRIFELFRRAGRIDRPGEGIGLAHVRSLVRLLGGDVTVQSRLGEGTTFLIDLPKKLARRAALGDPAKNPQSKDDPA